MGSAQARGAGVDGTRRTSGELRLEVIVLPVSDVDRPKDFYAGLAAAHGEHEKRIGAEDPDWPAWYAEHMVREQAGEELPQ